MVGNRFQSLLHLLGVSDLGVLTQRVDHLRSINTVRSLPYNKFGSDWRIFQGLAQIHAGAHQLVNHVGHIVARHACVARGINDLARHLLLLWLVGNASLDRDITNNGSKIRADLGRNS